METHQTDNTSLPEAGAAMVPGQDVPVSYTDGEGKVTTLTLVRGLESRLDNLHRCATRMRDWHKRKFCGAERSEAVRLQDSRWGVLSTVGTNRWDEPDDYEQRPLAVQAPPEFRRGSTTGGGNDRDFPVKVSGEMPAFVIRGCYGALESCRTRWPDLFSTVFSNGPYVHTEQVAHDEDYRDNTYVFGGSTELLTAFVSVGTLMHGGGFPIGQLERGCAFQAGLARVDCLFTPNERVNLTEFGAELYMTRMAHIFRTALVVGACMGWDEVLEGGNVFASPGAQEAWVSWMKSEQGCVWALSCMTLTGRGGPALRCAGYDLWNTFARQDVRLDVTGHTVAGLRTLEAPAPARTTNAIQHLAARFRRVMELKGVKFDV